jgi:hypothetical protein
VRPDTISEIIRLRILSFYSISRDRPGPSGHRRIVKPGNTPNVLGTIWPDAGFGCSSMASSSRPALSLTRALASSSSVRVLRRFVRRLAFVVAVVFLGCAPSSPKPILDIERHEQTDSGGEEEAAWAALEVRARTGPRVLAAAKVTPLPPTPRELFAIYRAWPPSPPIVRGPEAPSPPVPHLLS